jgi:hypothetical protein
MCDHFEESRGGDADVFEVVDIFLPGFGILDFLLLFMIIVVERVAGWVDDFFDAILGL